MTRRSAAGWALAAAVATACGHDFEPPDRTEQIRMATAAYAPSIFDTVAWGTPEERETEGNRVYVNHCRNCHGPLGAGDTEYARERGLQVPSLVEAGWPKADRDSVRLAAYAGHEAGMPVFGAHKLTPREIDAVAAYVLDVLRPDVLGPGAGAHAPPAPSPRPPLP